MSRPLRPAKRSNPIPPIARVVVALSTGVAGFCVVCNGEAAPKTPPRASASASALSSAPVASASSVRSVESHETGVPVETDPCKIYPDDELCWGGAPESPLHDEVEKAARKSIQVEVPHNGGCTCGLQRRSTRDDAIGVIAFAAAGLMASQRRRRGSR